MRNLKMLTLALVMTSASVAAIGPALAKPADVGAAVAATANRSADNVKLDESRKPAEVLQLPWSRVRNAGDRSVRRATATGPRSWRRRSVRRAMSRCGSRLQFYDKDSQEKFATFQQKTPNAHLIVSPFEAIALDANAYDFMMINLNYHDVYWESAKYGVKRMEPDAFLKTVYDSMKPGGIVGRHRSRRKPRRHPRDGREVPSDRSGRGQGRL